MNQQQNIAVLIVDHNDGELSSTIAGLLKEIPHWDYDVSRAGSYREGIERAETDHFDVYIVQDDLGDHSGIDFLTHLKENNCTVPVLLVTHEGCHEEDVAAMKAGAADYLFLKSLSAYLLERAIRYAMERARILLELQNGLSHFEGICRGVSFGILLFDGEGQIKYANPAVCKETGYSQEDICQMQIQEIYAEDIGNELIRLYREILPEDQEPRYLQIDECCQTRKEREICYRFTVSLFENTDADEPFSITLVEDITEKIQMKREIEESEKEVRSLAQKLIEAQETERRRLANDLHDGVGGTLTALLYSLENKQKQADGKTEDHARDIRMVQQAMQELRRLSNNLRPPILDRLGLIQTIRWFCSEYTGVYADFRVSEDINVTEEDIPEPMKVILFRIIQEAFNNAAKYSNGNKIELYLKKEAASIRLWIRDNGDGFDLKAISEKKGVKGGLGLISMRERVEVMGGSFDILSVVGDGTELKAEFPLAE